MDHRIRQDVLGPPYTAETIELAPDEEGEVVATLVHRPAAEPTGKAVLHLHGFADYFFQTGYAEWWTEQGYDFYALDLRKYGRSLLGHQTPNYVADLAAYHEEIDAAWQRITERDAHDAVIGSAHSTGGLTLPLWAHQRRPDALTGMVLNSPWFDMPGPWLLRTVGTPVVRGLGRRRPHRVLPRPVSGVYVRSLHREHEGEFDFDLAWKPERSWPVHAGWLRAIRLGHARLQRGLDIGCPALVLTSDRSTRPIRMGQDVHSSDIVLDVAQIRRHAHRLGPRVTLASVPGARHDVVLSLAGPRARVYDELESWLHAYPLRHDSGATPR